MSRILLSRLESQRRYKEALRTNVDGSRVVESLPESWLSDRGLTRSDVRDRLEKMFGCAETVEYRQCDPNPEGEIVIDVLRASWCKLPAVCPVCSSRLQARRRGIYKDPIREAVARHRYRYMVTFTVKDGPDLGERLDHLRASFRSWYRMGQRRKDGKRSGGEAAKCAGMLCGVELKKTDAGLWHVHIHALVFSDERLNYQVYDRERLRHLRRVRGRDLTAEELRGCVSAWGVVNGVTVPISKVTSEWLAASGDSVNVDCRPLRGGWLDVQNSALEVLKYSSKLASARADLVPGKMVGRDLLDLVVSTYGRRLFMALRSFRSLARLNEFDAPGESDDTLAWDHSASEYRSFRAPLRFGMRVDTLSESGKLVGVWRRERRALLDRRSQVADLPAVLDSLKVHYRDRIAALWRSSRLAAFVDRHAGGTVADIENRRIAAMPVQESLFPA